MSLQQTLASLVRDVPDFPKPGVVFKDITPLLQNGGAFSAFSQHLADRYADQAVTQIVGIESRGFIFGAGLATRMGLGLTLVRKRGKLPRPTSKQEYTLEYGTDELHIHSDALGARDRVVIVDDVLATGGTAAATIELVRSTGATVVESAFLMELCFLEGRARLPEELVYSVLQY
jgi:adenine phosphoribosyltransferase